MTKRPLFIAFEGLDGSGKSTCAAGLARRLDATLLTTPSPEVRRYRDDLIRSLGASQEAHQLFYLATVFSASVAIRELLRSGRSVVLDRYFLSTQAYASFRGSQLALDEVQAMLLPADATVYMDVPLAVRRARLSQRGATAADLETITDTADQRLRHEHFRRATLEVVGRFVRVDGAHGTAAEVLERAVSALDEILR